MRVGLAAACLLVLAGPGAAAAAGPGASDCGERGVSCTRVPVPLDWSGATPGKLSLHVEVHRLSGARGAVVLMAGGPGQASTRYFDIGDDGYWSRVFPGYTLVSFDPRGTGASSPVKCDLAGVMTSSAPRPAVAARCAEKLGPARDFFRTSDNVLDVEAVRQALGLPRIALYGASYGTDVALGYARAFPSRVTRLVLDSVASPLNDLPTVAEVFRRAGPTLDRFCAPGCGGIAGSYADEVAAVADALDRHPIRGLTPAAGGGARTVRLDGIRFLDLVLQTDLDPGLAAELPAAVAAERGGDPRPLLRLAGFVFSSRGDSGLGAVYVATSCNDGPFPWSVGTPPGARSTALAEATLTLLATPRPYGVFEPWAADLGNAALCLAWPDSTAAPPTAPGPYPDIPVLAVSGTLDLRSPTSEARAVLAHFPRGRLLTVENAGHAALADAPSACVLRAVNGWLDGSAPPATCAAPRVLHPLPAFPPAAVPPATTADALVLVRQTIAEAEATWVAASYEGAPPTEPGLRAGRLRTSDDGFTLSGYELAGGIALTGEVRAEPSGGDPALRLTGIVRVEGGGTPLGTLSLDGDAIDGRLGDVPIVDGRPTAPPRVVGPGWSTWAPPPGSTAAVAQTIAAHVGAEYRLDAAGTPLLRVSSGPAVSPVGARRPLVAVEFQLGPDTSELHATGDAWTYTLCGRGPRCSIAPGPATVTRARLVRRQALELALDTFAYEPALSSVLVYVPPPPGATPSQVIWFQRSQLAKELGQPLARTLTLPAPPLPSDPDPTEARRIDLLTLPNLFGFKVAKLDDGGAELRLSFF
jgi:pimeloyl-ACP methyl ester carboxylesterase